MNGKERQRKGTIFRRIAALVGLACLAAVAFSPNVTHGQIPSEEIVADIQVRGNRLVPTEQVLNYIYMKPGQPFSNSTAQKDVERLALSGMFRHGPTVSLERRGTGSVTVVYTVEENPNIVRDVIFRHANHISDKELESIARVRKGGPLDPIRNKLACFEIQDALKKQGRLWANVTLEEGDKPGDTRVVFNVTEGPIVRIRSIRFTGQDQLASEERLKTQINSGAAWFQMIGGGVGGTYDASKIDEDVKKVEDYYKNNGFLSVRVSREIRFSDDFQWVDLKFHLEEGVRYKVKRVSIETSGRLVSKEKLEPLITQTKAGEYFNETKATIDAKAMQDWEGYRAVSATVEPRTFMVQNEPGVVNVVFQEIERNQEPAKVGHVYIVGNTVTRDSVIRRMVGLYPGQYLRYPEVKNAENNLARAGIFEANPESGVRPTVTVIEDTDSVFKDVIVNVKETHTGSIMFGAGINSDAGLVGSVVINEKNFDITRFPTSWEDVWEGRAFRGAGQEFRVEAQPGTDVQNYAISWRDPFIFDLPYSLGTSLYYRDRVYNEYTENRYGGRVSVGHQFTREISASATLRVEEVNVSNVYPFAPPDYLAAIGSHFLVAPGFTVAFDTRDSYLRPTEGTNVTFNYEQVMGDYSFPILNLEASRYFTTYQRPDGSGKHVLAARTQVAWEGQDAPVFERFFAGGFRSMRGFEFRGVGPFENGYNLGGHFMLLNSLEYQVPIRANDNLYVVGFVDSGTVEQDVRITDYRVTAGVGLRITIPAMGPVPIALDFGFPIVKGSQDRTQVFSFWVGLFR
jgi:outer membrane protein assembly factor BamA